MRANKESYTTLNLDALELNEGQLKGVPKNPRFIRDEKFQDLKKSIKESPEFLRANTLKVYQLRNGKYIVIGGNMRLRACRELLMKEVPCYVFPKSTTMKKLREYALKDNLAYGQIDWDDIANEWDAEELKEWSFDMPEDFKDDLPPLEDEEPLPDELTAEEKNKPLSIKIVCTDKAQLEEFSQEIQKLIDERFEGANFSVSGGEL